MKDQYNHKYDDIINLPVSYTHLAEMLYKYKTANGMQ